MIGRLVCVWLLAAAGCAGKKQPAARCEIVERSVREVDGQLEVLVLVRWSAGGKNYRMNKPAAVGRFDPAAEPRAALEARFAPGGTVPCTIDPERPTRVDLL